MVDDGTFIRPKNTLPIVPPRYTSLLTRIYNEADEAKRMRIDAALNDRLSKGTETAYASWQRLYLSWCESLSAEELTELHGRPIDAEQAKEVCYLYTEAKLVKFIIGRRDGKIGFTAYRAPPSMLQVARCAVKVLARIQHAYGLIEYRRANSPEIDKIIEDANRDYDSYGRYRDSIRDLSHESSEEESPDDIATVDTVGNACSLVAVPDVEMHNVPMVQENFACQPVQEDDELASHRYNEIMSAIKRIQSQNSAALEYQQECSYDTEKRLNGQAGTLREIRDLLIRNNELLSQLINCSTIIFDDHGSFVLKDTYANLTMFVKDWFLNSPCVAILDRKYGRAWRRSPQNHKVYSQYENLAKAMEEGRKRLGTWGAIIEVKEMERNGMSVADFAQKHTTS